MTAPFLGHTNTKANADLDAMAASIAAETAARTAADTDAAASVAASIAAEQAARIAETNARTAADATLTAGVAAAVVKTGSTSTGRQDAPAFRSTFPGDGYIVMSSTGKTEYRLVMSDSGVISTVLYASNLLLDRVTTAAVAYGLRKLRFVYAGSALRIQRSSDATQLDIGFNGLSIDEAALTAFVGAGNGDVVKLYDQSGNGRDVSIAAGTMRLVAAGAILRGPGGVPKITATAARMDAAIAIAANVPVTAMTVTQRIAGTASGFFGATGANPFNNIWYGFETTDRFSCYVGDGIGTSINVVQVGSAADAGAVHGYTLQVTPTTEMVARDGVFQPATAQLQRALAAFTPSIGTQYRTLNGDWYECVAFTRVLSQTESDAVHSDQGSYYGFAVTTWASLTARPTIMLMGQSNCSGRAPMADVPLAYQGAQANVSIWTGAAFATLNSTLNNNQLGEVGSNRFAWEMSVGKDYSARVGLPVNLIKYGVGGSPLNRDGTNISWDPTYVTGGGNALYYDAGLNVWNAIIAMQAAGLRPDFKALQWFQGEQDATVLAWANAYQANLTAFIAAIRSLVGSAALPIHLMRIANENTDPYDATVRAAQAAIPGSVAGVTMIDTDPYPMLDTAHLNGAGQIALGQALALLL